MRARESDLWDMEEKQIHERQQLAKRQLKDAFFLQRHQVFYYYLENFNELCIIFKCSAFTLLILKFIRRC